MDAITILQVREHALLQVSKMGTESTELNLLFGGQFIIKKKKQNLFRPLKK